MTLLYVCIFCVVVIYSVKQSGIYVFLPPDGSVNKNVRAEAMSVRSCLDFIDKDKTDYVECFFAKAIENGEIIVYDYRAFLCNLLHVIDGSYVYLKGSDITSMDIDAFIEFTFNKYWRSIANF